jgi:hypothetical protein
MQFDREIKGLDRSKWGKGPWQSEPDLAEWRDPTTGYPCLALRHTKDGNWCAYVALPADHPWIDQNRYHLATDGLEHDYEHPLALKCREITYGPAPCQLLDEEEQKRRGNLPAWHRVCHVPRPCESDDVMWIGFDCGWSGQDYSPAERAKYGAQAPDYDDRHDQDEVYRTLDYVVDHANSLARQAKQAWDATMRREQGNG